VWTLARTEAFLEAERRQLPLWMPVALGTGISAWFLLPTPADWLAFGVGSLALAALGLALPGWTGRAALFFGLLATLGLGIAWARSDTVAAPRLIGERRAVWLDARVIERQDREGRGTWRLYLEPDDQTLPRRVRVAVRQVPPPEIAPNARIRVRATLRTPPGPSVPGGYDFARRAWFEETVAIGYALGPPTLIRAAPPPSGPEEWLEALRTHMTHRLQTRVGGGEGGLAAAFVTGDAGGVPEIVRQDMTDAGLAHIISISGLHIAVVIAVTMIGVRRLLTLSPWIALRWPVKLIAAGAAAFVGVGYTLLVGSQVPTVRSVAASLLVLAGVVAGRAAISLRTIGVGAFFIMLIRPEALMGPSFQLSFAAVTSLVAGFQSKPGKWIMSAREDERWFARKLRGAATLIASGCVAEFALAPIALFHFNREGMYGMLANMVGIPWSEIVIMPALMVELAMDALGIAAPAVWVLKHSMHLLIQLAHFVAGWPGAVMRLPTMPMSAYIAFVIGGFWLCLWDGRARLLGLAPIALCVAIAFAAHPPDLIVSADGQHVGVLRPDGTMAMLRPHAGPFIRQMWGDSMGTATTMPLDEVPNASCGRDACVILLRRDGRDWRVFATRSRRWIARPEMEAQCRAADIVVAERYLPRWCAPAWWKLDARVLGRTGALALWLGEGRVASATAGQGEHPWATPPPVRVLYRGHARPKTPYDDRDRVPRHL